MSDRYIPSAVDRETFNTPTHGHNSYQIALRETLLGGASPNSSVLSFQGLPPTRWDGSGTRSMTTTIGEDPEDDFVTTTAMNRSSTPPPSPPLWPIQSPKPGQGFNVTPPHTPERLMLPPRTPPPAYVRHSRRTQINTSPSRALDAPSVRDDPRCSLLDWGANNCIILAIDQTVYGWSADSNQIDFEFTLTPSCADYLSVLKYTHDGSSVVMGYSDGIIEIRANRSLEVMHEYRNLSGHVTTLSMYGQLIAAGTDRGNLAVFDLRMEKPVAMNHSAYGNTCSVQWSPEGNHLACSSEDGDVGVWHIASGLTRPSTVLAPHAGPVRGLAWSPHQRGLLASAGMADGMIHFDNVLSIERLKSSHATQAAVYCLHWSRTSNEIVSAHGPRLGTGDEDNEGRPNTCVVWDVREGSSLSEIQSLKDHVGRVVYMAASPDGTALATIADETMRLWSNVFPPVKVKSKIPLWGDGPVLR